VQLLQRAIWRSGFKLDSSLNRSILLHRGPKFWEVFVDVSKTRRRIWVTQASRFAACNRLRAKARHATVAITALSASAICLSASALAKHDLSSQIGTRLGLIALTTSILTLILAASEPASDYVVKAERLESCARKLSELNDRLTDSEDPAAVLAIVKEYHRVIAECPENHDTYDHRVVRLNDESPEKAGVFTTRAFNVCYWVRYRWMYLASYLLSVTVFAYSISLHF